MALAYYNRGVSNIFKGDVGGAIADFSGAIRVNPNYSMAYSYRGNIYYNRKQQYDLAIADYDMAIKSGQQLSNRMLASLYNERGMAHEKAGYNEPAHNELALADFKKASELGPDQDSYKDNVARLAARVELYKD